MVCDDINDLFIELNLKTKLMHIFIIIFNLRKSL